MGLPADGSCLAKITRIWESGISSRKSLRQKKRFSRWCSRQYCLYHLCTIRRLAIHFPFQEICNATEKLVGSEKMEYDVAIIGGGPAGSTTGSVLKKYHPDARVLILEREVFPRPHVGESMLPPITQVLEEIGCWDKVESAGFPIKIGAVYRWGTSDDLWRFDFLLGEEIHRSAASRLFRGPAVTDDLSCGAFDF